MMDVLRGIIQGVGWFIVVGLAVAGLMTVGNKLGFVLDPSFESGGANVRVRLGQYGRPEPIQIIPESKDEGDEIPPSSSMVPSTDGTYILADR